MEFRALVADAASVGADAGSIRHGEDAAPCRRYTVRLHSGSGRDTKPMTFRFVLRTTALVVFCAAGTMLPGQEWTRFRGPNGGGVSDATTIPESWTAGEVNWRVDLPGIGHGSPVVWGNRVYVNCERDEGLVRILQCRDTGTGELLWEHEFPATTHKKHKFNTFASSTPCVDEHHVYTAWGTPEALSLVALTHDGDVAWEAGNLGGIDGGHGFGTSPIVYGELVVIARDTESDSSLIALNRMTGDIVWNTPRPGGRLNYSTPCVFRQEGRGEVLVFVAWPIGVTAVDPADGSVVWESACFATEHGERAIASPVIYDDLVISTCAFVTSPKHLVALRPGAGSAVDEAYRVDNTTVPHIPSLIVYQDRLYAWSDQGIVTCYAAETGEKIWQSRVGGRFFGSPVCVNGRLYCASADGELIVLATGDEFVELARVDLGEESHATPAVAGGAMFIRTFSHLMSVGGSAE